MKIFKSSQAKLAVKQLKEPDQLIHRLRMINDEHVNRYNNLRAKLADMTTRISELEEASRWIPVSERLPEVVELVLCYAPHFHSVEIRWSDKIGEAVKYWRPMPDAPQEGEG